jgi:2-polyprenyl-3-methyl-5-hydroxy-6-metoxy-1,4-benzoquinol methylase
MSKYDFQVDTSLNTSTGIILNKIKPGSTVLEFGCATGRMTRYMKEVLNCRVYIVEYEKSAFDIAMQYAEDGVCDDILTLSWLEQFADIRFDSIIFADVLEHLTDPKKALMHVSRLLKENGSVYISIPNITHNDIILKAYDNHFDYTKTGLLDDTHVHFWGYENLKSLTEKTDLNIRKIEATYCETGFTEQYEDRKTTADVIFMNYLNERTCGRIYQFVVTLDKNAVDAGMNLEAALECPYVNSCVYLDTGAGFNQEQTVEVRSEYVEAGRYCTHYIVENVAGMKKLRFDPVELQGCILTHISVRQAGSELPLTYSDNVRVKEGILLTGTDPMVYAELKEENTPVIIDAEIILPGKIYLDAVQNSCAENQRELDRAYGDVSRLDEENSKLHEKISKLYEKIRELYEKNRELYEKNRELHEANGRLYGTLNCAESEIKHLSKEISNTQSELNRVNSEVEGLRGEVGAYIQIANKKDEYAITLEKKLQEYQSRPWNSFCEFVWNILAKIKRKWNRITGKQVR